MKNKTSRTGRLLDWGPNRWILMILIIWCLGISHIEWLSISVSASPSTISTSATYSVGFFPTVSIPASAKITIVFPSASYPTIPNGAITGWTASPFSVSSCIGSSSGYSVTLSLTGTSFSFVTLTIPGITNPSTTAGVSGYSGYLYDSSGNTLDSLASSGVLFTPSPKAFSAASISIASGFTNTVGATIDIVVSLTYSSTISAGSILIISFPKWDDSSLGASTPLSTLSSLIACTNNDSSAALTSSYTLGSGSNYDQLTITTLFSSAASSGSTNNIRIKNFINYPLLKTYSTSISVTTSDGNVLNSNSAVTFTPTVATTFSSASVAPSSTTVFIPNSYYLSVKLNTILWIGCYMRITLPTEVSNLNSTSSDILTSVTPSIPLNTPTIDKTGVSSSPKYFDLKSMVTSTGNYITRGQSFYVQINNLSNPPSVKTSGSFTVALYDSSGNMYEYQSTGLTVTATAGALTVGSSSAFSASSTGVSSLVDFSINLYAATAISSGSLGSVVVTFPSSFTLTTGTCTLTSLVGFFPSSCSISGQVVTVSNFPTDTIAAGDNIQFTIASKKIQLPTTTAASSTFLIQTQLSSYTVDSISTLTWNQTTAGVIGLPTPSTNAVTLGDYGTYKSTTYTFEIYPPGIVPQNSIITITFPSEITLPSSITCIQILSIGSTLSCSVSGSVLTISNGYSSAAQAFSGTLALKFSVASITNPRSLKPTSAFLFNILNSSGGLMYSVNNPQLTLTTPQTFASIAISSSTSINGKSSNYTWTLVTDAALQTGDFIKIAPPSLVSFSTSPVWTGITGLASSLSCTNNYGVLYIYIAFSRRNLASGSPGTYSFSVNSITNGPSTYPRAFTIQTSLSDQIYAIEQNSATTITNTVAGTIISASVKPNSYILGISTSYTVTFTPVNYIQGMGLTITVPSELVISDGTNTWTNLQNFADSTFSWVYTASTQTIVISGEFTSSSNPGQVSLTIPSILNPSSYKTTSSFKIDTYQTVSSVNYAIDSISSGLSVDVKCNTECLTCSVSASYCVTCDTNSSYKYFQSNSWVSTCSDGYYLSNSYTWSKWDSSCVKWSGTATNCIVYTKSTQTSLSMFAPFIFLIVWIIASIILLILRKWVLKHMRYVELEISIVSVIQTLCWIFYLIVLGVSGYFSSFGLVLASLFANIVFNIVTFILFKKLYSKDYEFRPFMHAHKFSKFIILGISLCLTHRFFHFTMSFWGIPFSAILRLSAKKFKIVNIVSLFFTDFIIWIAAFVNLAMSSTNEQAFYSSLEVIILSIFILILLIVELIIWKNYKTMQKTSPNLLTEHVSMFDMISNVSKITDRDEVTIRKSVLKKIMKRFPLKNLRRSMFTLNDEDNTNNYKRRLSFQEPKNKFDPDSENIEECKNPCDLNV